MYAERPGFSFEHYSILNSNHLIQHYLITLSILLIGNCAFGQTLPPGSLDPTFNPGEGLEANPVLFNTIRVSALDDGTALVGGDFISYDGVQHGSLRKINNDGSLNAAFTANYPCNGTIRDIEILNDGKILLASTNNCNGNPSGRLARINADGTLDEGFNVGAGFSGGNQLVRAIASQGDKILVGGQFESSQGIQARFISRLNSNGSADAEFNHPYNGPSYNFTAGYSVIHTIRVQADNKILVAGPIGELDSQFHNFQRLEADGQPDVAFNNTVAGLNGVVFDIQVLEDGKILIIGSFTQYNGTAVPRICRLNDDGSLDPDFNGAITSLDVNNVLNTGLSRMAVQPDGKIVVVGWFSEAGGQDYGSIVRLNADGSFDDSWTTTGTGLNYPATDLALTPDGNIYVAGRFWGYGGQATGGLIRLLGEPLETLNAHDHSLGSPKIYPNPSSGVVEIDSDVKIQNIRVVDLRGQMVWSSPVGSTTPSRLHLSHLPQGVYLVEFQGKKLRYVQRLIIVR